MEQMKSLMQRMSELQETCSRTNDIKIRIQIYQKLNELANQINELVQNPPTQPPPIQYPIYPAQQPPIQSFIQRPPPHTIQFLSSNTTTPNSVSRPTSITTTNSDSRPYESQQRSSTTNSSPPVSPIPILESSLNESMAPSTLLSYNLLR